MKTYIYTCDFDELMQCTPINEHWEDGFTNAQSIDEYRQRVIERKTPHFTRVQGIEEPLVVKPVKTYNKIRGVLDRGAYLRGESDCLVGKSAGKAMDVDLLFHCGVSFDTSKETIQKRADILMSAFDMLVEAGYNPRLNIVAKHSHCDSFYTIGRVIVRDADKELISFLLGDVDTNRYVRFTAEDMYCPDGVKNYGGIHAWTSQICNKGTPVPIERADLVQLGFNPDRVIGSYIGLDVTNSKAISQIMEQVSTGMKALGGV